MWFTVEDNPEKRLVHMKLLGYKWNSEQDILYPGFAKLNLNKKVRGAKKSNILPVVTLADAERLLNPENGSFDHG